MKNLFFVFIIFLVSCSSAPLNEHESFLEIKSELAKQRFSIAMLKIIEFRKRYPQSAYSCELITTQIAYKKDKGLTSKDEEKELAEKCISLKINE